jgi:subtilase family serine protease
MPSPAGAAAPVTYCNALFIDGEQVAEDCINNALEHDEELEKCFDYEWRITPPYDTIMVCADFGEDITESDEENNCLERVIPAPPPFPRKPAVALKPINSMPG